MNRKLVIKKKNVAAVCFKKAPDFKMKFKCKLM